MCSYVKEGMVNIIITSDPLQPDGCKLSVSFTFHINSTPIWLLEKHMLIIRP